MDAIRYTGDIPRRSSSRQDVGEELVRRGLRGSTDRSAVSRFDEGDKVLYQRLDAAILLGIDRTVRCGRGARARVQVNEVTSQRTQVIHSAPRPRWALGRAQ